VPTISIRKKMKFLITLLLFAFLPTPSHSLILNTENNKIARVMIIPTEKQQEKIYINPNDPSPPATLYVRERHIPKPFYKKPLFIAGGIFTLFILGFIIFLKRRNGKNK
jgi:hypothetical protein